MYVCMCKGVRLSELVEAAKARGADPEDLLQTFGFDDGDCCGRCAIRINNLSVMVRSELDKPKFGLGDGATASISG